MNIYSFSISSPDFIFESQSMPFAREVLSHLCHRWNDPIHPKSEIQSVWAGILRCAWPCPKGVRLPDHAAPEMMGSCSHSQRASCRCSAPLSCSLMFTHLLPPWAGSSLPSLEGVLETVWFHFWHVCAPTRAGAAPTQHVAGVLGLFVKCALPRVGSLRKHMLVMPGPFFLVAASCGFILSMFGSIRGCFFQSLF